MAEKGFTNAEVTHKIDAGAPAARTGNVTFNIGEGPKVKIREIDFVGNQAISDSTLAAQDEGEQATKGFLSCHHRERHLQGRQVRGRRGEASSTYYHEQVTSARASASPS